MKPASKHSSAPRIKQGGLTIIDANAGSGKTTRIIDSLSEAARDWSMAPERMLALTFNKEMVEELEDRLAKKDLGGVTAATLHAFCRRLVNEDPQRYGFTSRPRVLVKESKALRWQYQKYFGSTPPIAARLMEQAFRARYEQNIRVKRYLRAEKVSDAKIAQVIEFFKYYTETKPSYNWIGFYDMIAWVFKELKSDRDLQASLRRKYRFLAVDEYQDLNAQERALVQLLVKHIDTTLIVGDDLQSINTFRGASPTAMRDLKAEFPDARVMSLDQSWRLNHENAAFVNQVLAHNDQDKRIVGTNYGPKPRVIAANSRNRMYQLAAKEISTLLGKGVQPEDIAVLARFSRSFETFARYFARQRVPFTLSSHENTRDKLLRQFRRFLRCVMRVKQPKWLRILIEREAKVDRAVAAQLIDLDRQIPAKALALSPEQHKKVRQVRDAVQLTRAKPTIDRVLQVFATVLQGRQDRFRLTPIQHVLRLEGIQFDQHTTLKDLHNRVNHRIKQRKAAKDNEHSTALKEGVTLSTIHAAKGREWQHVLILDLYDENLSRNGELRVDEAAEFNVLHVALTRAKYQTHLFLLKHEAAVDAVTMHQGHEAEVHSIEAIAQYQYANLRFLPPFKDVKALCAYQRTDTVQLTRNDPSPQPQTPKPAQKRAGQ